ncbi:MAG TPA: HAD family hydrolase [Dehalococcoidia bacterium]|nr:HAD family hydrolase [Dehalococcoidia bacterium]
MRATARPPLPDAIFFDMDGTILDWQTGMEASWAAACSAHCDGTFAPGAMHELIRKRRTWFWSDAVRAYAGRMDLDGASREIVRHAFADSGLSDLSLAHRIADDYRARRAAEIAPYPGAIEALEALRAWGVRMALITNGEAKNQRRSVERFGLERYFDCIIIEGEFGAGKPDERVFRHALATTGCEPAGAWMVGDSLEADIAPAAALGLHAVWVNADGEAAPDGVRPHRVVRSIAELV